MLLAVMISARLYGAMGSMAAAAFCAMEINTTIAGRATTESRLGRVVVDSDGAVRVVFRECTPNRIAIASLLSEIERRLSDISGSSNFEHAVAISITRDIERRKQGPSCEAQ